MTRSNRRLHLSKSFLNVIEIQPNNFTIFINIICDVIFLVIILQQDKSQVIIYLQLIVRKF